MYAIGLSPEPCPHPRPFPLLLSQTFQEVPLVMPWVMEGEQGASTPSEAAVYLAARLTTPPPPPPPPPTMAFFMPGKSTRPGGSQADRPHHSETTGCAISPEWGCLLLQLTSQWPWHPSGLASGLFRCPVFSPSGIP